MRPIDADELKSDYFVTIPVSNAATCMYVSMKQIMNTPTIDAVPVIRCKYCRYLDYDKPAGVYCCTKAFGHQVSPNFYCDFAKERDNEVERIQTTAI